jgi:WD40 repeat protein
MLRKIALIALYASVLTIGIFTAAQEQEHLSVLRETKFPKVLRQLVNTYVGKGWQLEKSIKLPAAINYPLSEATIDNIYYIGDLLIAVANQNKKIIFCENKSEEEIKKLEEELNKLTWHENSIARFVSSHKVYGGEEVITISNQYGMIERQDRRLILCQKASLATGNTTCIKSFESDWNTNRLFHGRCFSYDEQYFAVSSCNMKQETEIIIYGLTKEEKHVITLDRNSDHIKALAMSPDNKYIAMSTDNKIMIINIASKEKEIITIESQDSDKEEDMRQRVWVRALTYSPCGKYLITALSDGRIHRYEYQPDLNS